jgi:glycogen debranching enzyme
MEPPEKLFSASALRHLEESARQVLRENDAGRFTEPGPRQYPHQWNWDSAFIALGLSSFDLPRALVEIRSLLDGQWKDGMLPHVIYHDAQDASYFPQASFWEVERSLFSPACATSGITQPPVLTSVIRKIHERYGILPFVREVYPKLFAWHRWFMRERVLDSTGLVCLAHPWESGTDDSPRWLPVMKTVHPPATSPFQRRDRTVVDASQRPYDEDYRAFVFLIELMRAHDYDWPSVLRASPFVVQDVLFNSILYRAHADLLALANDLGLPGAEIRGWMHRMSQGFSNRFWDEASGLFLDFDLRAQRPLPVNTIAAFAPLYAGLATQPQAERLVLGHLADPHEYAPDAITRHWVPSTSKAEPAWEAQRYWRGPIWFVTNGLVLDGLMRYEYEDFAQEFVRDTLRLALKSGFWEYYDPRDGRGLGSPRFSWSAAITLDLLLTWRTALT